MQFNLKRDEPSAAIHQQIDFSAGRRSPIKGLREEICLLKQRNDLLYDEGLPTRSPCGMRMEFLEPSKTQKIMQKSGIAEVNFWTFDEPFTDVGKVGRKFPD